MKRSIALIAFVTLLVGAQASSQDTINLKRTFKEGAKDVYTLTTNVINSTDASAFGQGSMELTIDSTQTNEYTYSDLKEDGTAKVSIAYKDIEMKLGGPMADMMGGMGGDAPKELKGTAKIDSTGKLTDVKFDDSSTNMARMMMGGNSSMDPFAMLSLPKDGVVVGKEFKPELPKIPVFDKMEMTGKVVGEAEYKGLKAWNIEYTGTAHMNMDMSEMMKGAGGAPDGAEMPKMVIEGNLKMHMVILVEKGTGRPLTVTSDTNSDGSVNLVDMNIQLPTHNEVTTKMALKVN